MDEPLSERLLRLTEPPVPMAVEEHRERHVELHRHLDELFADYIRHHPNESNFLRMPFEQFLKWSYEETLHPTELPDGR